LQREDTKRGGDSAEVVSSGTPRVYLRKANLSSRPPVENASVVNPTTGFAAKFTVREFLEMNTFPAFVRVKEIV
jgi:hypothetical protein